MSEDRSLDIVGVGQLAEAVPDQVWTSLVDTDCSTFKHLISPLTAITSGTGRLIEAKFDRLVDAEKVIASQTMSRAADKASRSSRKRKNEPKLSIILQVVEDSSSEVDTTLRELWTNLVANEFVDGSIHPEFVENKRCRCSKVDRDCTEIRTKTTNQISLRDPQLVKCKNFPI